MFKDKSEYEKMLGQLHEIFYRKVTFVWCPLISPTMTKEERDNIDGEFGLYVKYKDKIINIFCQYAFHYCPTTTSKLNSMLDKSKLSSPSF